MTHNLYKDPLTGQMSMMYTGDVPWHRLGTKLDQPATSQQAIRAANLDWQVDKYPLQNEAAFRFFDEIVGQKAAIYETAGALGNGERVWILAKMPDVIRVLGDDICEKYLVLSNSHDGKSSVQMKFTPIRVVCQNTLTMALSDGRNYRVAHTGNVIGKLRQTDLAQFITKRFEEIEQGFRQLAAVQVNRKSLDSYYRIVFPDPIGLTNHRAIERVNGLRLRAAQYFENGKGNQAKGVAGTLWAAYNGIAEMVDYHQPIVDADRQLNSIWFGDGYLIKAGAYRAAIDNLKTWAG